MLQVQALVGIIFCSLAYKHQESIKYHISLWMKNFNLIYVHGYLETIQTDPEKYLTYSIIIFIIYITVCILYIYGAYVCNNAAMVGFISVELVRLITLSILVTICLLVLKQNTMDIGLVIGASVVAGFVLLGLFYLWVCAANLPTLINEIEREEHIAKIEKLQQLLLENKNQRFKSNFLHSSFDDHDDDVDRRHLFVITRNFK
ncbi:uncharacterized protein LOC112052310 [Bicyclus anynana]|uniref:Uncharacterized protein LOC112052310 n=1 Tax=Bicyclus anynana TaxID=110368 RepID=A0ABM3LF83_BICAN|nr:uncharacterized protein LOC112052310 [Bicyclus anynana]